MKFIWINTKSIQKFLKGGGDGLLGREPGGWENPGIGKVMVEEVG